MLDFTKIVKGTLDKYSFRLLIYIRDAMGQDTGSAYSRNVIAPNTTKKLQIGSGALYRSFTLKHELNINEIKENNGVFDWTFGSKSRYAVIHETGGFIKGKNEKNGRTAMERYFWARFKESRNPYMKNIALSVHKKGGIRIPARPYFEPALKEFDKIEIPMLLEDIFNEIKKRF